MIAVKKDFNDKNFAECYIKKHKKIIEKLGYDYAKKLASIGFEKGKILDAGCGFGGMDVVLAKEIPECEIIGIDLSEPLLEYANSSVLNTDMEEQLKFKKGDVQKLYFEENTFDVVFSANMVHLVGRPIIMLNEIERVLKPDGYIFIKDLRRSWLGIFESEIKSAFTLEEAQKLIGQSKLRKGTFSKSVLWWNFEVC
jgi:ubiquinone/menaquinone biosynthesis C-methylase UbiE